jgi:hypothetical protein
VLRAYNLTHQHGAACPFAAEAETHQRAEYEQLGIALGEAAQKRKKGEPDHRNLQGTHPPEPIRQYPRKPAAQRRCEQRYGPD